MLHNFHIYVTISCDQIPAAVTQSKVNQILHAWIWQHYNNLSGAELLTSQLGASSVNQSFYSRRLVKPLRRYGQFSIFQDGLHLLTDSWVKGCRFLFVSCLVPVSLKIVSPLATTSISSFRSQTILLWTRNFAYVMCLAETQNIAVIVMVFLLFLYNLLLMHILCHFKFLCFVWF